jgi:hypothetical protein
MDPATESTIKPGRPLAVTRAVQLFSASFIIGAIRSVFDLAHKLSGVAFVLSLFFALLFFGILFFFVAMIAAGKNWARIVALIMIILGLILGIPMYLAELRVNLLHGSISIAVAILQLIALALLFTKTANQWFKSR